MCLLLIVQVIGASKSVPSLLCVLLACLLQFFFLSAFSWMTVMSFDICLTFKSLNSNGRHLYRSDSKTLDHKVHQTRLIVYSIGAWGGPLVFMALTLLLDSDLFKAFDIYKPKFGEVGCWFRGDLEA